MAANEKYPYLLDPYGTGVTGYPAQARTQAYAQQPVGFNPMDGLGFKHMMARNQRAGTMLDYPKALQNEDATTVADRQARQSRGQPEPVAQQPSGIQYDTGDPNAQFEPAPTPSASYQRRDMSPAEAEYVAWVQQHRRDIASEYAANQQGIATATDAEGNPIRRVDRQGNVTVPRYVEDARAKQIEDAAAIGTARDVRAAGIAENRAAMALTPAQQAFHDKGIAAIREHTPASGPYQSEQQKKSAESFRAKHSGKAGQQEAALAGKVKLSEKAFTQKVELQDQAHMDTMDVIEANRKQAEQSGNQTAVNEAKAASQKEFLQNARMLAGMWFERAALETDAGLKDAYYSRGEDEMQKAFDATQAATPPPAAVDADGNNIPDNLKANDWANTVANFEGREKVNPNDPILAQYRAEYEAAKVRLAAWKKTLVQPTQ